MCLDQIKDYILHFVSAAELLKIMKTKSCGTCDFWDIENASYPVFGRLHTIAPCKNYWNSQAYHESRDITAENEGQDCPVYKERQDAKNVE